MSQVAPEVSARRARARRRRRLVAGLVALPLLAYLAVLVVRRVQIAEAGRGQTRAEREIERLGGKVYHHPDHPILDPFTKPTVQVYWGGDEVGDAELAALDGFPDGRLTQLHLMKSRITDAGLAKIGRCRGLVMLVVEPAKPPPGASERPTETITDAGLAHLNGLPNLMNLSLRGAPITDAGLDRLGQFPGFFNLNLSGTKITDRGLARLPEIGPNLSAVVLDGCPITDEGVRHLARMPNLAYISLKDTPIGDAALESLRSVPGLQWLFLEGTRVTDAGLETLARMPKLRQADVRRTGATAAGVARLKNAPGISRVDGP